MKVAVMGAGAVGCYFGGMLARAGHEVTLVARPQHVDAVRVRGLHMETKTFDEHVKVAATTDAAGVAGAQLVLFCVKSADTEAAGAQIRPHLAPDTLVLCLQNGVDNADRLRTVVTDSPVGACVVYVGAEMLGPGHLKHHGRGELVIEPAAGADAVAKAFVEAGVPAQVSAEVKAALWQKLVLNCAYNAISAIARKPYGDTVGSPGIPETMRDVIAECLAVADAEGVALDRAQLDVAIRRIIETIPAQYSSTAQDLMRGKPTEIDFLNGHIVRRGEALGIPVPANRVLWALVKLLELDGGGSGA